MHVHWVVAFLTLLKSLAFWKFFLLSLSSLLKLPHMSEQSLHQRLDSTVVYIKMIIIIIHWQMVLLLYIRRFTSVVIVIVIDSTSYHIYSYSNIHFSRCGWFFFPGSISGSDSIPLHNCSVWRLVQKLVLPCNSTNVSIGASDWLLHWQQWKSNIWQHFARHWRQSSNWGDKNKQIYWVTTGSPNAALALS